MGSQFEKEVWLPRQVQDAPSQGSWTGLTAHLAP